MQCDSLCLHLAELLTLLRHLVHCVLLLLLQAGAGSVLLDAALLQVLPQLGYLALPLLVELDLSVCCASGLVQTLTKTLHLSK